MYTYKQKEPYIQSTAVEVTMSNCGGSVSCSPITADKLQIVHSPKLLPMTTPEQGSKLSDAPDTETENASGKRLPDLVPETAARFSAENGCQI